MSVSPHWLSQDPSQLEEEWSRKEKEQEWMFRVSQSVDMVVGGYSLNCTQPLLLPSPEAIVFLTVVASMSPVKLVLLLVATIRLRMSEPLSASCQRPLTLRRLDPVLPRG